MHDTLEYSLVRFEGIAPVGVVFKGDLVACKACARRIRVTEARLIPFHIETAGRVVCKTTEQADSVIQWEDYDYD